MQDAFSDFLIFALQGARDKKSHIKKTRLMAGFLSGGTIWVRTGDLFDVSEAL